MHDEPPLPDLPPSLLYLLIILIGGLCLYCLSELAQISF